jgi:hypothetical protein
MLLILAFVIPTLFWAFATKAARPAVYKSQAVLSDGVNEE